MAASSGFFKGMNPQAVLKHGLVARYAGYFPVVAGKQARRGALLVDGYSGEGRYDDGTPGSPLLLVQGANRAQIFNQNVRLAFIEADPKRMKKLQAAVSAQADIADAPPPIDYYSGAFEDAIPGLQERMADRATFIFADPFGLGIPTPRLIDLLQMSRAGQPVDVLYHFSLLTVARMAAAALSSATAPDSARKNADPLDKALGGVDWRQIFQRHYHQDRRGSATQAALVVADRFAEHTASLASVRHTSIQVRRRPSHLPIYSLILFSASAKAHWDFADQAGKSYIDWLLHCEESDWDASMKSATADGQMMLIAPERPSEEKVEALNTDRVVPRLVRHLASYIRSQEFVIPQDNLASFYGPELGQARTKHARAALRHLHERKLIDDDAKGDFWERPIRYTG